MQSNDGDGAKFSRRIVSVGIMLICCSLVLLSAAIFLVIEGPKLTENVLDNKTVSIGVMVTLHYIAALVVAIFSFTFLIIGIRLVRSQGVLVNDTIPDKDYEMVSNAIKSGNETGINLYIKIRSLSGGIGACTKLGLSGLSLATIFLTVFFTICGIKNNKSYDLAQLTLGAFIGSFVQKKNENNIPTKGK